MYICDQYFINSFTCDIICNFVTTNTYIYFIYACTTGVPTMVPGVTVDNNTFDGNTVILTLSWREPFNNFDPIVNYTVSCSSDVTCPPNFTTTDSTTRSYTITNLMPGTKYTFSVVATNSIGSGEAGVVIITTPPGENVDKCMYIYCMLWENFFSAKHSIR